MKISYLLTTASLIVAGCSRPDLEFKKERLTGEEYCTATHKLHSIQNSDEAELILKSAKKETPPQKSDIKAMLKIAQNGREYKVNSDETLDLFIDGTRYPQNIINAYQNPQKETEYHQVYLASGNSIKSTITEVTRRKISFVLSADSLLKISKAQSVHFEIRSPSMKDSPFVNGYPIILKFSPENIALSQDFKDKCVNNFLNK